MVGVLGYLKVDVSARVLSVLLGLELLIVAIWDAAVLSSRVTAGELTFSSFDPHVAMAGSVATGLIFAVSCFSGFEATAIFRDEVRGRSEAHTSEPQSLRRIQYSVFCWKNN